jgi:ABC-type multidrug transport system ATPase subunit
MKDRMALRAVEVSKDYGDGPALHPLSLSIAAGERVALIGHNGSGKTTFLRIAAGLLDADTGRIEIFGASPNTVDARRHFSFLSDTPTFYDDLSVREHLEYAARLHGVTRWERSASELLELLGLVDRADDLPSRFSRGLRQKTAIAIGMIRPFEILLVDEPFVGLDAEGRDALLELLVRAHDRGAALVVATHELGFVDTADRTIALREGTVVFDGETSQARARGLVTADGANAPKE